MAVEAFWVSILHDADCYSIQGHDVKWSILWYCTGIGGLHTGGGTDLIQLRWAGCCSVTDLCVVTTVCLTCLPVLCCQAECWKSHNHAPLFLNNISWGNIHCNRLHDKLIDSVSV